MLGTWVSDVYCYKGSGPDDQGGPDIDIYPQFRRVKHAFDAVVLEVQAIERSLLAAGEVDPSPPLGAQK